jgi:phage baseplate assembly protein gpV
VPADPLDTLMSSETAQRRDPLLFGVYSAKVTGKIGEGYELKYLGMGGNAPSAPARVMASMAGNKRGNYFMPEIGDEVIVAFDAGDGNMPIILGAVWNGESPVPSQAKPSTDNNIRTMVSRSGHEITFDDTRASEQVHIKSKGGHEVILDDTPPGKVTVQTAKGSKIELDDATGILHITSPTSIILESATVTLAAGAISMAPPVPAPGMPPFPTGPTTIKAPVSLILESTVIQLKAASIELTTTGSALTSMVVIDGHPFGAHVHDLVLPATTGPVSPPP